MTHRYPGFPLLLGAAALTLVAGCTSSSAQVQVRAPVEKPGITVAVVPTTDSTGFYLAMNDGLFAQQGLHVTYVPAISAEDVINQQALGKIDVVGGNYVSDIEAQINYNHGVRATNQANPSDSQIAADLDIVAEASVMQPNFVGLFTMPGSPVTTVQDLKGQTIGINAPGNVAYLLVAAYLEAHGMSPSSVRFKYIPFPEMTKALQKHQVGVAFLAEPFVSIAEETVGVTELTNLDEGASTAFPIEGYTATKEFAKKYPGTLAAFERALEQGQQIADTDRFAAEKAMEAFKATDGVDPVTAALLTFESYPLGQVDAVRIQRVANDMREFGLISRFNVNQIIGTGKKAS